MLTKLADAIWNPWILGLFFLTGGYYTLRTGFFQLTGISVWLKTTVGAMLRPARRIKGGGITQFQALATALASTIGTGSIAGVATAIFYGGPGAVFWMWLSAFLGMMTGCAEKILAVRYRRKNAGGGWEGGPMEYMARGLHLRVMAWMFSLCCAAATLTGGGMVQANSISTALEAAFGWERAPVGIVTAALTALVVLGGIKRIGKVNEALVPVMAVLFLCGGGAVLLHHAEAIPGALGRILTCAFTPDAIKGGAAGYGISAAIRYGVARGVFTNEAGLGSSAMAHAAADVGDPAEEGMWGIFEVFVATLLICTVTALVILSSGVYNEAEALKAIQNGTVRGFMLGAPLSAAAFGTVFGRWGGAFVAVCLFLFAFSSLLGWSYYGERSIACLTGTEQFAPVYRGAFLMCVMIGSLGDVTLIWQLADICNGLMALPNLVALLFLSPEVLSLLNSWLKKRRVSAQ